jgi:hypothetical protein
MRRRSSPLTPSGAILPVEMGATEPALQQRAQNRQSCERGGNSLVQGAACAVKRAAFCLGCVPSVYGSNETLECLGLRREQLDTVARTPERVLWRSKRLTFAVGRRAWLARRHASAGLERLGGKCRFALASVLGNTLEQHNAEQCRVWCKHSIPELRCKASQAQHGPGSLSKRG